MAARRILHAVLAVAIAWFAWVQLNDPDPWLWVALYGAACALFVAACFGWSRRWAMVVVWVAYLVQAVRSAPGFLEWLWRHPWGDLVGVMSEERQYIEDSREFVGLLIAAACLVALWFWPPRVRDRTPEDSV